jgi:hypothetical protein
MTKEVKIGMTPSWIFIYQPLNSERKTTRKRGDATRQEIALQL